jgi:hypothetical protein
MVDLLQRCSIKLKLVELDKITHHCR